MQNTVLALEFARNTGIPTLTTSTQGTAKRQSYHWHQAQEDFEHGQVLWL